MVPRQPRPRPARELTDEADAPPGTVGRLHEAFRRRLGTRTVLAAAETVPMLSRAPAVSGRIVRRKDDGRQSLAHSRSPSLLTGPPDHAQLPGRRVPLENFHQKRDTPGVGQARGHVPSPLAGLASSPWRGAARIRSRPTTRPFEVTMTANEPHADFTADPMTAPRYMGIATFMRAPYRDLATLGDGGVDIGIVGVPYDNAVTNRSGARHGPRHVRDASTLMRKVHHVTRRDPFAERRVADLGDVPLPHLFDPAGVVDDIEGFHRRVLRAGIRPLTVGGDHSITYPVLRALGADAPVGLVHVDAHTDTWDQFLNTRFSHGAPFRRAVEAGVLDPTRTVQIGIRGAQNATEGWDFAEASGMRVVFIEELVEQGVAAIVELARRIVGDGPTYVSFDIDALDPAFAPGTGTPELGGLTPLQAQQLVRGLHGLNVTGADVVEVSPPFDHGGLTALAGATMAYELLNVLAA